MYVTHRIDDLEMCRASRNAKEIVTHRIDDLENPFSCRKTAI